MIPAVKDYKQHITETSGSSTGLGLLLDYAKDMTLN
jgi:hypothetical protein